MRGVKQEENQGQRLREKQGERNKEKYMKLLGQTELFSGLGEEEILQAIEEPGAVVQKFSKDQFVYREGQKNVKAAIVLEGRVHIMKEDFWGNRSILAEAGPGEMFAETYSCLGDEPLAVSVVAAEECRCLFVDLGKLQVRGSSNGAQVRLLGNIIRILAQKNLFLSKKAEFLSQRTTRQKLLSYLSDMQRKTGKSVFRIPFNRQQLADFLSVDRSAMSAELSRLQKEGILRYHKNQFTLLNRGVEEERQM